jgi:hypothetical protein
MYHSGANPLRKVKANGEQVYVPKGYKQRQLHKAFLRYHDVNNWPLLRDALKRMGRSELIGNGEKHLVPRNQPADTGRLKKKHKRFATQHVRPKHEKK